MLWDLLQQYQIGRLDEKLDRVQAAALPSDNLARDAVFRLEEKLDRLTLISRAMFELLQETGMTEEKLSAKVLEIDLRDGQRDGKMSPPARKCPTCDAMMSPKFGRCLFCGHRDDSGVLLP